MKTSSASPEATLASLEGQPSLARSLGLLDATMVVMGGIVGSGIFINAYVVAQQVHTPVLILGAWAGGGLLAMLGGFIYAELADRMPAVGGQYAYLREAYHPIFGFLYGWVLLLVIQTGGMAAVTITFARYFRVLTGTQISERVVAVATLAVLTIVNCLGVKLGSRVQSGLMMLRIAAIAVLAIAGFLFLRSPHAVSKPIMDQPFSFSLVTAFAAAMTPVLFAYGGWQTANFIAGEIKDPRKNLPRALLMGVAGVIALYVSVNVVYLRALGPAELARTTVPATATLRLIWGDKGATLIAFGIGVSTVGFLSQAVLTAPRVYFAMANDGVFFRQVAAVNRKTHVPVVAIILQSVWTAVVALSGRYEQILNYVVSMDFLFFGLTATCIFVFRRRELGLRQSHAIVPGYRVPGHPVTTTIFIIASWLVVLNTIYKYPSNTLMGVLILLLGVPVYFLWQPGKRSRATG
jgi:APA family basic amino acid/polyamine antiporter